MICAWQLLLGLLPVWMRDIVDKHGRSGLLELRMRVSMPPILRMNDRNIVLDRTVSIDDLKFCINMVTRYSPWSVSTASKCYYTAPGGHRIGLCGNVTVSGGQVIGVGELSSLCIRIARDFEGIAKGLIHLNGSVLILGRPGCGKTTLLRDYIRQLSYKEGESVTVVDERKEIFPFSNGKFCFNPGMYADVISGCAKSVGIEAALRNTGPTVIAVDEITAAEDCNSLMHAGWCGVKLIATAHAGSREDLFSRPVYKPLVDSGLFEHLIIMHPDKSWHLEEMKQ